MDHTIDSIRSEIAKRSVAHIRECEIEKVVMYFVWQSFTGSGKSVSVMKAIDEAGYTWIYLAPFHEVIKENLEYSKLRNYDFIHLKGKEQDGVCLSPEYRNYVKMGINITPFCETRCPYRFNGCSYYETKDLIESFPTSWAGVHSHIPTYLQSFMFDKKYLGRMMYHHYDVIIIDEFPFQVLFNQVIVSKKDIDDLRNVLSYMNNTNERYFIMNFLNELTLSTEHIDINYSRIKGLLIMNRKLDLDTFYKEYERALLDLISYKTIEKPPKQMLFNIILIYKDNPTINILKWNIYKHNWDGWSKEGIYITTSNIKYFQNIPIPIIALDATADINAWNTLLNDNCLHIKIDMEYRNLYQLRSRGRYPVSTWLKIENNKLILSDTGKRLCDLIIKICDRKKESVLLCSNKRIKKVIEKYLKYNYVKSNYIFAIFYNLRSRNIFYETCDTCIITHEPNIPPLQLQIMHNVIDWDVDLLNDLMTTSEIRQGIGRIRQNIFITPNGRIRENIETFILPGAVRDIEKILEEAKLLSYEDIYVGKLVDLREVLIETLRQTKICSLDSLREYTKDVCSYNILKSELKKLYLEGYTSNYKNQIMWIWDEDKAKQPIYTIDG